MIGSGWLEIMIKSDQKGMIKRVWLAEDWSRVELVINVGNIYNSNTSRNIQNKSFHDYYFWLESSRVEDDSGMEKSHLPSPCRSPRTTPSKRHSTREPYTTTPKCLKLWLYTYNSSYISLFKTYGLKYISETCIISYPFWSIFCQSCPFDHFWSLFLLPIIHLQSPAL